MVYQHIERWLRAGIVPFEDMARNHHAAASSIGASRPPG
jgi:hypothetical protein